MSRGILVIVSGFSGAGKGTVMKRFLDKYKNYALSISVTTRAPRENEVDGRDYFFRSREEFEKLIEEDALLEYAEYSNNYYGTPRSYVEQHLREGKDVVLEIEMQGAMKVKKKIPEALMIFITPPSVEELIRRLQNRGTETKEQIVDRMMTARNESCHVQEYDYLLVNDNLEECVDSLHRVIQSEHFRSERETDFIRQIQKEFETVNFENI